MELTFVTDLGESYAVEIDPNMELENVMALLEAEVSDILPTPTRSYRRLNIIIASSQVSQLLSRAYTIRTET
jgi:hypothetical protein